MADVVAFTGITKLDTDPDRVLAEAADKLEGVVICGVGKDGDLYFASSFADGADVLWWMRRAEHALMKITDALESGES
ncbi:MULTISPECIES: hypothetical protein [unclassified Aureimonas]|uniref:hypothetical protein n=1 Tax=unclassified Aureimonas TaxID=2615206 RepID=UPI0006FB58EE|nr:MULTISPECIES: hypothetical protein [unclassified Aureimonas]KQT52207.1 hypothetical protein ASG62_16245 [Aureimonas sp. Leaf427]KQT70559.1 hypothetical protein ASG54_21705 [Aureimonas sp. Leaf460]